MVNAVVSDKIEGFPEPTDPENIPSVPEKTPPAAPTKSEAQEVREENPNADVLLSVLRERAMNWIYRLTHPDEK